MYLYQRNHSYYFRMRTSSTFSLQFGITEVRQSLKTKNKRTAQKFAISLFCISNGANANKHRKNVS
ncbi:MAG: hypothetical protein QG558_136 [Campylobacterota bacterium]|nr:hypothetical protein [Campylobacterota bacterium]